MHYNEHHYPLGGFLKKILPSVAAGAATLIPGAGAFLAPIAAGATSAALNSGNKNRNRNTRQRPITRSQGTLGYRGGGMVPIGQDAALFIGASHKNGGIDIGDGNEVEGGETIDYLEFQDGGLIDTRKGDPYIFSDKLEVPGTGKTFAEYHMDLVAQNAPQGYIKKLATQQEKVSGRNPGVPTYDTDDFPAESKGRTSEHPAYEPKRTSEALSGQARDIRGGGELKNTYREGGYYAVKASETEGDEPKYPINSAQDVKDAWKLRNHGKGLKISQEQLENRIKRKAREYGVDLGDNKKRGGGKIDYQDGGFPGFDPESNLLLNPHSYQTGGIMGAGADIASQTLNPVSQQTLAPVGVSGGVGEADVSGMGTNFHPSVDPTIDPNATGFFEKPGVQAGLQFLPEAVGLGLGLFGKDTTRDPVTIGRGAVRDFDTDVNVQPQLQRTAASYRAILSNPNATGAQKQAALSAKLQQDSQIMADKLNRETQLKANRSQIEAELDARQAGFDEQYRQDKMASSAARENQVLGALTSASQKGLGLIQQENLKDMSKQKLLGIASQLDKSIQEKFLKSVGVI